MKLRLLLAALALALAGLALGQSNVIGTLLASAARTTTTSSADVVNTSYKGAHVLLNITSYTSGNWTLTVEGKDPVSNNYYTICTGPTVSATGMTVIKVYPGIAAQIENAPTCNDFIPRQWRITMTGASSPSATFSVGYMADF